MNVRNKRQEIELRTFLSELSPKFTSFGLKKKGLSNFPDEKNESPLLNQPLQKKLIAIILLTTQLFLPLILSH